MVVNEFDTVRVTLCPPEADPPLIVDADTVLPGSIPAELLEAVSGRRAQVIEGLGRIENDQLSQHHALQRTRVPPNSLTSEQPLRVAISETLDHLEQ